MSVARVGRGAGWLVLALAPGLFIVFALAVYPLALAAWTSLEDGGRHYAAFLASEAGRDAVGRTVGLALATMVASIALSIPLGYMARRGGWRGTLIRTLVALPLAVPVLIAGYALTLFLSDNGLLNNVLVRILHVLGSPLHINYTWGGLVAACTWRFFPYTGLLVITALQAIDRDIERAAASAGAGPLQVFWRVTLPVILPATITGGILTFVSTFGTFSIPLMMARGGDVLSVMAYRQISGTFDWSAASTTVVVMSVIQIVILIGLRAGVTRWAGRR